MSIKTPKEFEPPKIIQYLHCMNCYNSNDIERQKKSCDLAVGMTENGIQVYCEVCHTSVAEMTGDFKFI